MTSPANPGYIPPGGGYIPPGGNDLASLGNGPQGPTKPLPPNDPWVKAIMVTFPNLPLPEAQVYAAKFRDNMFAALKNQIDEDNKRHEEEKQREKEMNPPDNG